MSNDWDQATPARKPSPPNGDRLPPHSDEMERGFLGSVLLGGQASMVEALEWVRQPGDFYDLRHRLVWETLLALDTEGTPPEITLLTARLRLEKRIEEVGGPAYVSELLEATPGAFNLAHYGAGLKELARRRRVLTALANGTGQIHAAGHDAELLDRIEQSVIEANTDPGSSTVKPMVERVKTAIATIQTAFEHRNQGLVEMATGFTYLDKKTTGLHKGQLWLIGGRPGTGKTSWMVTLLLHLAVKAKVSVGFLSMEMTAEEITLRLLCNYAGACFRQIHSGMITEGDKNKLIAAAAAVATAPIFIDDTPALTPQQMRNRARRLVSVHGAQVVGIDHLSEVSDPAHKGDENKDSKAAVASAKWIARSLKVPVVALQQLNREFAKEAGKRKPRATDLRGHGTNEQVADVIGILFRDYDREREASNTEDVDEHAETKLVTMEICKQRNGPTGEVHFVFDCPPMKYFDCDTSGGGGAPAKKEESAAF